MVDRKRSRRRSRRSSKRSRSKRSSRYRATPNFAPQQMLFRYKTALINEEYTKARSLLEEYDRKVVAPGFVQFETLFLDLLSKTNYSDHIHIFQLKTYIIKEEVEGALHEVRQLEKVQGDEIERVRQMVDVMQNKRDQALADQALAELDAMQ